MGLEGQGIHSRLELGRIVVVRNRKRAKSRRKDAIAPERFPCARHSAR